MDYLELIDCWHEWSKRCDKPITSNHHALMLFLIATSNQIGSQKVGLPTEHAKTVLGIGKSRTFLKILDDLVEFGFIKMIQRSVNQHTSNQIWLKSASEIDPQNQKVPSPFRHRQGISRGLSRGEAGDKQGQYNIIDNINIGEALLVGLPDNVKEKILERCKKLDAEHIAESLFIYLQGKEVNWKSLDKLIDTFKKNYKGSKEEILVEPSNGMAYVINQQTGKREWLEGGKDGMNSRRTAFWLEDYCKRTGKYFDEKLRDL
jgi:hypothetical protein